MAGDGVDKLRRWANQAARVAEEPVSQTAREAIKQHLIRSAIRRMERGVDPAGRPFKPLSPGYAKRKRKAKGHSRFWQWSGQSRRRVDGQLVGEQSIRLVINTPWSRAVHDGSTHRVTAPRSSSIEAHNRRLKRAKSQVRARNKRLREVYDKKTTKAARLAHETLLKQQRAAGMYLRSAETRAKTSFGLRSAAAVKRGVASRLPKKRKESWTVTIPARPVLGIDTEDRDVLDTIITKDLHDRLGATGG